MVSRVMLSAVNGTGAAAEITGSATSPAAKLFIVGQCKSALLAKCGRAVAVAWDMAFA